VRACKLAMWRIPRPIISPLTFIHAFSVDGMEYKPCFLSPFRL
jgi:hypothetical protein